MPWRPQLPPLRNAWIVNCIECLGPSKVTETRTPDSANNQHIVKYGKDAFGWWSSDYRVRIRTCRDCDLTFYTIEVSVTDLLEAFQDAKGAGEKE